MLFSNSAEDRQSTYFWIILVPLDNEETSYLEKVNNYLFWLYKLLPYHKHKKFQSTGMFGKRLGETNWAQCTVKLDFW